MNGIHWQRVRRLLIAAVLFSLALPSFADQKKAAEKLRQATQMFRAGNLPRAEKLARDALKEDPQSVEAHSLMGDILITSKRYSAAAREYTAALDAEAARHVLSKEQLRILRDQQGVAYGLGGQLDRAQEIFTEAIRSDPDYPLFYYNLACVYAEKKQLDRALENLKMAWERRSNLSSAESFPDPRKDPSFGAYVDDPRFQEAVRDMVF